MSVTNSIIHPSPQLCTRCALFPWPSRPALNESLGRKIPVHDTFESLQESADQGCALCRFVWSSLVYDCTTTNKAIKSWMNRSVFLIVSMDHSEVAITSKLQRLGEVNLSSAKTRFELVESSEGEVLRNMKSRQVKASTAKSMREDVVELTERQIKPWMEACQKQRVYHQHCTRNRNTASLPTRLVDVGQMDDDMVRLVDVESKRKAEDLSYLILSYCWGNGNLNSLTTEANLAKRLQGFAISNLPKTIRDAILLTRAMGFRYLWIDAICIIQGRNGDFHAESPKMGDYYSNSACCISAASSNNSSKGFLIERPLARYPITHIGIRINHSGGGTPRSMFQEVDNSPHLKKPFLESPLTKRGWCWQELALPTRILHWTPQGLFLECSSSLFLEDTKTPWHDEDWIKDLTSRTLLDMPEATVLFYAGWYRLVALFSHTKLTYEKDRLYAIHGLTSVLLRRTKSEYFNGLFRRSLAQGLLWYHDIRPGECSREENAHLPSWCWARVCPVDFIHICETTIYIKDDHPERPSSYPTTSEDLSTVESSVPRLHIRAHVIQLTLEKNKDRFIREMDSEKAIRYYLDRGSKATPPLASFEDLVSFGGEMDVLWMPIGRVAVTRSDVGLLIYKLVEEGRVVYRRYGTLQWEGVWNDRVSGDLQEIILV